jgi:sec-independent protein translocase protein TatA
MGGLGWQELLIIFLIVFVLFGAKRLPEVGRSIGRGMREFKRGISGLSDEVQKAVEEDHEDKKAG